MEDVNVDSYTVTLNKITVLKFYLKPGLFSSGCLFKQDGIIHPICHSLTIYLIC